MNKNITLNFNLVDVVRSWRNDIKYNGLEYKEWAARAHSPIQVHVFIENLYSILDTFIEYCDDVDIFCKKGGYEITRSRTTGDILMRYYNNTDRSLEYSLNFKKSPSGDKEVWIEYNGIRAKIGSTSDIEICHTPLLRSIYYLISSFVHKLSMADGEDERESNLLRQKEIYNAMGRL